MFLGGFGGVREVGRVIEWKGREKWKFVCDGELGFLGGSIRVLR